MMPQYSPNLGCGSTTGVAVDQAQCRGGCRIPFGTAIDDDVTDILAPTYTIEVAFKIVWPTPCIGLFENGALHVLVRAV